MPISLPPLSGSIAVVSVGAGLRVPCGWAPSLCAFMAVVLILICRSVPLLFASGPLPGDPLLLGWGLWVLLL